MKRIYYLLASAMLVGVTALVITTVGENDRQAYAEFLRSHPYYPDNTRQLDLDAIPKQDRPDLAWQQNYLLTMDPKLKRPAPERLAVARQQITSYFDQKSKSRTGTEEFPWIERGPNNVGGRTRGVMWDPNDAEGKKVWAGGVSGGLWYTTDIYDEDVEWEKVDDFWSNLAVMSIASDPNDSEVFYASTGEGYFNLDAVRGAGIWKSTDGGESWSQLSSTNNSNFYYVQKVVVTENSSILAATRNGLYRSTDGGENWTQLRTGRASDIELAANGDIYASFGIFSTGQVFKSVDGGANFTDVTPATNLQRIELATAPSDENVIYAVAQGTGSGVAGVYKSTNGGSSWTTLDQPDDADTGIPANDFSRSQAWYDLILAVDPNNADVVLAGAIDLFRSSDGGDTWDQLSHWYGGFGYPYVHADQHAIVFKPGSSTDVVFGHDGGIDLSISMDETTPSFINRNNNYNITQFYAAAIHPEAGRDYFLAGSQDNGTQKFTLPGLGSTSEATGGDGGFCFIDQTNPDVQITAYVYNQYWISTNGGTFSGGFSISDANSGSFINPSDYDDNLGILYTATNASSVGRFRNIRTGSPSRSDISVSLSSIASHLRVSPHTTSSTTLFVGTSSGDLFKITNADGDSPSATNISSDNFPNGSISCVEIGATENDLLVIFSNYGVTSVWQSSDGGSTWSGREGNLPDMPIRWALFNPNDYNEVILATEMGIWRTETINADNPVWEPSNIGLANVRVDMLQIRDSDKEVIAATHGRGLYSSSGFSGATSGIRANFSVSAAEILINNSVDFTDLSTGDPVSWEWTFEGGTPATSTDQNPSVTYATAGVYDVSLTVTDADGNENTKTVSDLIEVSSSLSLPNLASYRPNDWEGEITVSNVLDDFQTNKEIRPGDNLYIAYVMANFGETNIEAPFKVRVELNGEEVTTVSYSDSPNNPFLGNYYRTRFNIDAGEIAAGEYTIRVTLDVDEEIEETEESDNVYEKTFSVACETQTYTELTGTIADGSGSLDYGNNVNCTWVIEPEGEIASITLAFSEFDLEESFDYLYVYAGDDTEPLESLTGNTLPDDLVIESSSVRLVFETDESVVEGGWSLDYTATQLLPDLAILNAEAQQQSRELDLSVTVSNQGDLNLSGSFEVNFYLSDDEELSSDDILLSNTEFSDLGISEETTIAETVDLPEDITTGSYHVIVILDESSEIQEKDESNNEERVSLDILILSLRNQHSVTTYPNPVTNWVTIEGTNEEGSFTLTNLSGQVVTQGKLRGKTNLNMEQMPKGIYLLSVRYGEETTTSRIKKN